MKSSNLFFQKFVGPYFQCLLHSLSFLTLITASHLSKIMINNVKRRCSLARIIFMFIHRRWNGRWRWKSKVCLNRWTSKQQTEKNLIRSWNLYQRAWIYQCSNLMIENHLESSFNHGRTKNERRLLGFFIYLNCNHILFM